MMSSATARAPAYFDDEKLSDTPEPLHAHVRRSVELYFDELNGQDPAELYDLLLSQVEQPLLEVVMKETRGNISKAAQFLGMNRATLRKKLHKYGLTE